MSEQKTKFESELLKYVGKELKKEGARKDKAGVEHSWKLFQLKFDVGREYPRTFSCFNNTSTKGIQPSELEEGNYYEIIYIEEPYTNSYGPQLSKSVKVLHLSSKESYDAAQTEKNTVQIAEEPVVLPSVEECKLGLDAMKEGNPDISFAEYVGGMVLMKEYMPDLLERLTKIYEPKE